ncbi:hypothetical protein LTR97_004811 [Elasticomyces elasticus]|uniref:Uncharacterized protein n=1 Tax=Elasticomyces elasticus TaxID=574655 RepID=A0AAN8A2P8_9PEZI|nr:hypothetical protein LTR97_004811 [Elasticomyces elasticus]
MEAQREELKKTRVNTTLVQQARRKKAQRPQFDKDDMSLDALVQALVKPFRSDSKINPRSSNLRDTHIIAIVLLLATNALDLVGILTRITQRFAYFAELSARDTVELTNKFGRRICDALRAYELPITRELRGRDWYYSITRAAAYDYLRNLFPRTLTDTTFAGEDEFTAQFFGLPAELRNMIYDMVFTFPASGVRVTYDVLGGSMITTMTREMEEQVDPHAWDEYASRGNLYRHNRVNLLLRSSQSVAGVHALAHVNQAFRAETEHLFFKLNRIHFLGAQELRDFMNHTHPNRRPLVKKISVNYVEKDLKVAAGTFQKLARFWQVEDFSMHIDEDVASA